ncbi:rho GTPase-activating protein 15 isoform X1 [Misgurnus anguillicaudatus]|uniref:rho GTPase-activating protein 15 isoform X1 n=1 Tax=Misgurnus anguillicaudatus TaxID=75329 RepID=UPI00243598CB|nr:rho GTPase-activating protein 15 isoform X1 [Misgurnus anguillicaudatus]XP_055071669.1 rho GTPase-activating protein 15 isoform X1 [Misgurnus anguillicaudatus]
MHKQPALVLPGAVQMRIRNSQNSPGERLSQTKSMVLSEPETLQKPVTSINRHRRNQSQHNIDASVGLQPALKGEYLNKAKIAEGGKKLRKNWTSTWVVLSSNNLLFYKESKQEAVANLKPGCKPDGVDLCGAAIEWTTEKSSRKNVIQITTPTGHEFLLQADHYPTISKWHDAIKKTVDSLSSGAGGQSYGRAALQRSNSTECVSRPTCDPPKPKPKESKSEHRRSIMFKLNYSASDSADKNGVKNRLKKFISRRPSMKTLQEKGIIKDRVFGCHILTLCERERTTVPRLVKLCVEEVEKRGLEADGLYRVSGNLAVIQKLRFLVDEEEELDLGDSQWEDIHVITGALKMFFRELPEPLFPFRFFELFVEAIKIKETTQKVQAMKKLIHQLPKPNHNTMKLLFHHLRRVLTKSRQNLMSTQGISIVFGPTLMWPEFELGNMEVNMVYQNQIVEFILIECIEIFGPEGK